MSMAEMPRARSLFQCSMPVLLIDAIKKAADHDCRSASDFVTIHRVALCIRLARASDLFNRRANYRQLREPNANAASIFIYRQNRQFRLSSITSHDPPEFGWFGGQMLKPESLLHQVP
jgi:hypothetical protein